MINFSRIPRLVLIYIFIRSERAA